MRTARFGVTRRTIAMLALVAVAASACTVTEVKEGDEAKTPGTGTSAAWADATTQGVTADSVKLGAALVSAAELRSKGVDIEMIDPEALLDAWVEVRNAAGGINGRTIDFSFAPYVPISDAEAQTACVKLAEDEKVFAILGQLSGDNTLCVAETHALPYVGLYGLSNEREERAKAPFVAAEMSDDRQRAASIATFVDEGEFEGKRVALYSQSRDAAIVSGTVKPALEEAGVDVVVETTLDDFGGGASGGTDQTAVDQALDSIVEKMRSADVDVMLNVSNFADPLKAFQRKGWSPDRILVTTAQALSEEVLSQTEIDPALLAKVLVAAPYSPPKDELLADDDVVACIDEYNSTDPAEPVDPATITRTELGGLANLCSAWQLFVRGVEGAGKTLTAQSWGTGVEKVGDDHLPGYPFSSLGPDKHDLGDAIGVYEYDATGKLFVPVGDPIDAEA